MPSITVDTLLNLVVVIVLVLFFLVTMFVSSAVKIVPENKRIVLFRMGRSLGTRGPGIVIMLPFLDMATWVDLQYTFHFRYSNLRTADHRNISSQVTLEGKIVDPEKSVLNVPNLETALYKVVETEMIDIARGKPSDELMHREAWLEDQLKQVVDRASRTWGFDLLKLTIDEFQQV